VPPAKEGTPVFVKDKKFVEGGMLVLPEHHLFNMWVMHYYRWIDSGRPKDIEWLKGGGS
jgi:hypothetical protein